MLKRTGICLLFVFMACILSAGSISIQKSVSPAIAAAGDTVTFCISMNSVADMAKADIMWVIDISGSMSSGIANIQSNITYLTSQLAAKGIDYRQGIVTYSDIDEGEPVTNYGFLPDDTSFLTTLNNIMILNGGDIPESGLEGVMEARNSPWRSDATKTIILVTDAQMKTVEDSNGHYSIYNTANLLKSEGFQVHTICEDMPYYPGSNSKILSDNTSGMWLDYYSVSGWNILLNQLGTAISNYTNLKIRDPLPPGLTPLAPYGGGTYSGGELVWTYSSYGKGVPLSVCFPSLVTSSTFGSITNTVYAGADGEPESSSNPAYVYNPAHPPTLTLTPTITPTRTQGIVLTRTCTMTVTMTTTSCPACIFTPSVTPTSTQTAEVTPEIKVYPNPFSRKTAYLGKLKFTCLPDDVIVMIYTVSGELVTTFNPDGNEVFWDVRNRYGKPISPGVYYYVISWNNSGKFHKGKIFITN